MYVRRKSAKNRRRKKSGRRAPLLMLLMMAVIAVIGVILYMGKEKKPTKAIGNIPPLVARQKMPERPAEKPLVMEDYSSIVPSPHQPPSIEKKRVQRQGTVAIIIDDMGSSLHEADALLAIGVPVTFSIIPGLNKGREVAAAAHREGREVMLHIPMEPKGYQQKPFEKNGLLVEQTDEEIQKRTKAYLASVPYAVGANNHMGSRFTEERPKMQVVLKVLKGKHLFFIDSKTTSLSVAERVAREMAVPVASRNIFLDNEQEIGAIRAQLAKLADMARKNGSAIGICHPHPTTIQALAAALPAMRGEGIKFVYASELVK